MIKKFLTRLKISEEYIQNQTSLTKKEIRRRAAIYSGKMGRNYEIKDKTVILIDDGAATGATIIAACQSIRSIKPDLLIIGLPVAAVHTLNISKADLILLKLSLVHLHLPLKQLNNIIKITIPLVMKRLSILC